MSVEARLAAYREGKKLRQHGVADTTPKARAVRDAPPDVDHSKTVSSRPQSLTGLPQEEHKELKSVSSKPDAFTASSQHHYRLASVQSILKAVLWVMLWVFFIKVEFGLVFLIASSLCFLWWSLRGGRGRVSGEPSAYSVFNKDCEAIDGTLTAEQLEREMRFGPTAVK